MQMVVEAESLGQSVIEVTVEELCMLGGRCRRCPGAMRPGGWPSALRPCGPARCTKGW